MKTDSLTAGAVLLAAVFASEGLCAGTLGFTRFDPERPFEVCSSAPADAVALTPQTISNDVTRLVRVRAPLGAVSADDLERWHAMGIAVLAELPAEGVRTNAVSAWLKGCDGLVVPPSDALRPALADIAALSRLNVLAREVRTLKTSDKMDLEGRRGLFHLERINVAKDDPDLTRLNAYARIRRLAAFAKKPEGIAFDLNLPERPPLVPKKLATKRREGPSKAEIENALWTRSHFMRYDAAVKPWEERLRIAYEESLIGFPDPGVPTCCAGDYETERLFVERRLEIVRRKFGSAAEGLRCPLERNANKAVPPKVLSAGEGERRRVYALLPEMDLLVEEVLRLRIAYMLDRLNGRAIDPLPPPPKKAVELNIEEDSDDLSL